ncbi:MAG: NTP transferase domain-containing protein [Caulobacteraceae bacterium]
MKGLIVAAGQGTRIRDIAASKPLALVSGVPLIERVIGQAIQGGLRAFVVVTGYQGERLESFLKGLSGRLEVPIEIVSNPDFTRANGWSVVAAEPLLGEHFVLLMADHLFDPALVADLLAAGPKREGVILAVDRRLANPLVDLSDVTRVETLADGRIRRIGKLIEPYDAFDTGVFLASKALISAIRRSAEEHGDGGISGGMNRLAQRGAAWVFDIGERFWLDVDDAVAHGQAERVIA